MDERTDETAGLRRLVRDLVGLSALPAVWVGYSPSQIAESLADVLLRTLHLDLLYLRLRGRAGGAAFEVARTAHAPPSPARTREIGLALEACLNPNAPGPTARIANPLGPGFLRAAVVPLGHGGQGGFLVAGSERPDFPTEPERLLLSVATNQGASLLREKQADEIIVSQREQLRTTLASIGDAVIVTDQEGRVRSLNPVAEALTGWHQKEATGQPLTTVFRIVNEATGQAAENPVERVLREGAVVGLANHTVLVARDGAERPIDDSAAPIRDATGRVTGVVLVFHDVTAARQAQKALRESEERLRAISDNLPNGAVYQVLGDLEGHRRFVYISAGVERLFGVTPAEAMADANSIYSLVHEEDRARVAAEEQLALRDMAPFDCEFRSRTRTGELRWLHARSAPRPLPTGQTAWEGILMDVTRRKRAESRRAARLAVTQILAEAGAVEDAAPRVLQALCGGLGWDVGTIWRVDPEAQALRCVAVWEGGAVPAPEFAEATRTSTFGRGVGLPGRVWAGGKPVWITDVVGDANFPRAATAAREGLHGAFAAPVVAGGGCLGAVEFFARDFREPDADLLEMMATVGSQVGQFMQRRRAEEELRRSERELADFFDNATMGLHWVGPDGTILRVNQAELDLLGYAREEYVGHHIAEFHADEGVICDILRRLTAGEKLWDYEARMVCKDGSIKHVLINSSVLWEEGRFVHTRCFTRDVTEQKRAAGALRASEERFARFMQHLPGLAWIKDVRGRYVYANDAAVRAFGTPRAELYGKADEDIFPPETAARFRANDERALASEAGVQVVETLVQEDGVPHHSLVSKFPIPGEGGRAALVGGMAIDITEQKQAEQALRDADRRKDEFLATLAHELRNPLAPIRTGLQVMKLAAGDAEAVEQSRAMMERQLGQMARLLDDLLDVSRITRGKLQLRRERVNLAAAVQSAVEGSRPLIEASFHRLTVTLPPEPVYLEADPTRLAQVLSNLLTNAAKYTDRGGRIWLTAQRQGGEVVVSVKDTGIGIASEHLPRLFEMFSQVDSALERSQGGLGIGLSLVKGLVGMHGGSVEARSDGRGRGSEFLVRLPVAVGPSGQGLPSGRVEERGCPATCRILVADDNRDAADSLALMLRLAGHEVHAAHDGQEAVDAAGWFRPDVAFLDIGMPRLNGFGAARHIREQPWGRRMLLVAITGWGQEEDRRRATEAGFDLHLTKPVDPAALEKLLSELKRP